MLGRHGPVGFRVLGQAGNCLVAVDQDVGEGKQQVRFLVQTHLPLCCPLHCRIGVIARFLQDSLPDAHVLLLGLLPRASQTRDWSQPSVFSNAIAGVNQQLR